MVTKRQAIASAIASKGDAAGYQPAAPEKVTRIFGEYVFDDRVMKERLPKDVYKGLQKTIKYGEPLDTAIAEVVASTMKNWALEHGATHYTHWFHPLTGGTAEKHDAFIVPTESGQAILQFSGKALVQGEPDASSFPSGGIRATFEARGYTGWDPTSPAFIRKNSLGATLCIPTAFCSYTGQALDKKTPLLRSEVALSKAAVRLLKILGDKDVKRVGPSVGLEQEYFLIDMEYANARPDLVATGRTLFGAAAYKGQSLDDHYFGAIKRRILNFMQDSEQTLYKLGIPVTTRHNEVAPAQYEVAPMYEGANIAIDHNMLVMEVMAEVAAKHQLKFIAHEKPFAGLNGSGKHCNWSLGTDYGKNLLDPGATPHENLQFMVVLTAIVRGLDKYSKLLRSAVAHAGNDHRLGANEAPPAIISIFLGDELNAIVKALVAGTKPGKSQAATINLGATTLPKLPKDNTDRNRTSPFAFTGNKFEFRAPGASQHIASPVFYLNTIVADSLEYVSDEIQKRINEGKSLEAAADEVVKATLAQHERVIFNGDNYSEAWHAEAERRGLPNLKNTPAAAKMLLEEDVMALLEKYGVLSKDESVSRYNVKVEKYIGRLNIELNTAFDMAKNLFLPAALEYQGKVASSLAALKAAGVDPGIQSSVLKTVSGLTSELITAIHELGDCIKNQPHDDLQGHAEYVAAKAVPAMAKVRDVVDRLETHVEDGLWPVPKYREMLALV